jgi:hypothetical protein
MNYAAKDMRDMQGFSGETLEQVAVGGLHVEDGDLGLGPRLANDLEELAFAVGLNVQGDDTCGAGAAGRTISDF